MSVGDSQTFLLYSRAFFSSSVQFGALVLYFNNVSHNYLSMPN